MRRDGKKANGTICNAFAHLERTVANHRNVFLCNDGRFESNTLSYKATYVAGMFVVIGRRRYTRASAFKLRSTQRHSMSFFHVRL